MTWVCVEGPNGPSLYHSALARNEAEELRYVYSRKLPAAYKVLLLTREEFKTWLAKSM